MLEDWKAYSDGETTNFVLCQVPVIRKFLQHEYS